MTKRFTYNAAQSTRQLATVQAQLQRLDRKRKQLLADEANLKAFTKEFYDEGKTDIEYPDGTVVEVNYSETDRFVLDQQKVQADYARRGKRVPYAKVTVLSFKAKELK